MTEGWIKLYRKLAEKAYYKKDSEAVHLWVHILFNANRDQREEILGGKVIICNSGQFTTGRKQLSKDTGINESKIERLLTKFEKTEQQIEQQKTSTNRLISVCNWSEYQSGEQQTEQQLNSDRTTTEHTTRIKEVKNKKVEEKPLALSDRQLIFYNSLAGFLSEHSKIRIRAFYDYWSEPDQKGNKMRFELEKTWDTSRRLATWKRREGENKGFKPEIKISKQTEKSFLPLES